MTSLMPTRPAYRSVSIPQRAASRSKRHTIFSVHCAVGHPAIRYDQWSRGAVAAGTLADEPTVLQTVLSTAAASGNIIPKLGARICRGGSSCSEPSVAGERHVQRAIPGSKPGQKVLHLPSVVSRVLSYREAGRDTRDVGGDRADFFVSHAGADRPWAEWAAWQLTDAGYTVKLDAWDWPVGQNFVLAMTDALAGCDRVLALLSPAYFDRAWYTTQEWTAALLHEPGRDHGRLVPVRVENIPSRDIPEVLRSLIACDLAGLDALEARRVLLEAVRGPQRPDGEPVFPGTAGRVACDSWEAGARECRAACRGCGTCPTATLPSPAATGC